MTSDTITIYCDGAASPNPGKGGYGSIVVQNGKRTELSGGYRETTNNRMEILAAIKGVESLPDEPAEIVITTDSKYVSEMFNGGHALKWKSNGWMRNKRERALNPDLWGRLLELGDRHQITFKWVKGHSGHPENERCDQMAVEARLGELLPADEGYENPKHPQDQAVQQTMWDLLG